MKESEKLLLNYKEVRNQSIKMLEPLNEAEPYIQSMGDVSPPAWNLGHTTWFFKKILDWKFHDHGLDCLPDYLFNSYYNALGDRNSRGDRGLTTNPGLSDIVQYRKKVDIKIEELIEKSKESEFDLERSVWPNSLNSVNLSFLIRLGINHEQQHQELFYSEIKHIRWQNLPEFREPYAKKSQIASELEESKFHMVSEGIYKIGGKNGWTYDNEHGCHVTIINEFQIKDRLVTNGEYLDFINDGGYQNPLIWLANGWDLVQRKKLVSPMYWYKDESKNWLNWTLQGDKKMDPNEPVAHLSFYEADAYSKWANARLPTEKEWEIAASLFSIKSKKGNLLESGNLHPIPSQDSNNQFIGDVWEWTSSHYEAYPGFKEFPDKIGEYNGKFMDNQRVSRGGSCVTPESHIRISYRNFWPASTRFQFSGLRLVKG